MVHSQPKTEKRLFTEQEAADYLGMSRSYLRQDRMNSPQFRNRTPGPDYCQTHILYVCPTGTLTGDKIRYPANFCHFGTMIRYTKEALDKWIDDNLITRVND